MKMNIEEGGYKDANWIHQTQDRVQWQALVNAIMNLQIP
jgi:hypothetical protein